MKRKVSLMPAPMPLRPTEEKYEAFYALVGMIKLTDSMPPFPLRPSSYSVSTCSPTLSDTSFSKPFPRPNDILLPRLHVAVLGSESLLATLSVSLSSIFRTDLSSPLPLAGGSLPKKYRDRHENKSRTDR